MGEEQAGLLGVVVQFVNQAPVRGFAAARYRTARGTYRHGMHGLLRPHRFVIAVLGAVLAVSSGGLRGQDLADLRARCVLALGGETAPPTRHFLLRPRTEANLQPRAGVAAGAPTTHVCPLCQQAMVRVPLWTGRAGIDSQDVLHAHVCTSDALFFVTNDGPMHGSEAGPFAVPADAATRPARPCLPHGAEPLAEARPWPTSRHASADCHLVVADGPRGAFEVRNRERTLFRETRAVGDTMGLVAYALDGDAGLCAYARSNGDLVVGDLTTGKPRRTVPLRDANVTAIGIHPQGGHVAFAVVGGASPQASLRVLELATGHVRELQRSHDNAPERFTFAPGSDRLIAATPDGVMTGWSLARGELAWTTAIDAGAVSQRTFAVSPDASKLLVVSCSGLVAHVLDVTTGTLMRSLQLREPLRDERAGAPVVAAWSADRTTFAWLHGDGRIACASLGDDAAVRRHFGASELAPTQDGVRLRFAADGKAVETRDAAGQLLRWPLDAFRAPW